MKASDLIIDICLKHSVNRAWYVQGGAISHLLDSAYLREVKSGDFKSIFVAHEQSAGFAADAYSRSCDKLGAVMVTSGPGATNVMTSIASSWYDGVPVIYFTGQVRSWELSKGNQRQKGFQETDIISMTKDITKYSVSIHDLKFLKYEIEKAIFLANDGRPGPVVIDLPMDMQFSEVNEKELIEFNPPKTPYTEINHHKLDKINQVSKFLENAEKPVILLGGGIRSKKDSKEIQQYAKENDIALVTSFSGKHLVEDEFSHNFGFIGTMGMHSANKIMHTSDVLLVVGSRLSWRQIRSDPDNFSKLTKVIHVDVDSSELNSNVESLLTLNMNAKDFFYHLKKDSPKKKRKKFIEECKIIDKTYSYVPEKLDSQNDFHPHYVMNEISNIANDNTIFCLDTGQNLIWSIQGLKSLGNRTFISAWGHSPMGYSISAALGAAEVSPQKDVVCIIGDGGIQMNIQELHTIFLNKYNIKIIVVNNNSLGAIKEFQDDNLGSRYFGTGSKLNYEAPNFDAIGLAYNIQSKTISNKNNLKEELRSFFNKKGPGLLDIKINETAKMVLSLEKFH